ncbi:CerR family C-terminal domain-containing protein [Pseudorhodoplanes sp.]|uniref:CerR family C-terminal domain-containing protein n=1 Tax=Pseudorhodoplanes sp. TaxID=1934341 RepID=UPI003D09FC3A
MSRVRYNVDTPERIVKAATSLFARQGYRAVALKDVAREARVNGAAVNYHFGDKAELYRSVIDQCLKQREGAAPIDEEGWLPLSPEERLRRFITVMMEQLLNEQQTTLLSQIMLWEAIDPTREFKKMVARLPGRQLKVLDRIVGDWVDGALSKRKIRAASISILGQCVYYRYGRKILAYAEKRNRTSRAEISSIADEIFAFSAAALRGLSEQVGERNLRRAI